MLVKKKKDRKKFLFFLDSWKRGCFSPHPSLLTDIFDGNKRAKSSLCITSTHDFRDYGAVPLNGHGGNSAIRSCRQTSSVSGHASVLHHLRPSQGPLLPRQEYNIRLDRTRSRPREFLKFLIPLLAKSTRSSMISTRFPFRRAEQIEEEKKRFAIARAHE